MTTLGESLPAHNSDTPPRPQLEHTARANHCPVVLAVLLRELKAKLLTSGYLWSTIAFTAIAFFTPALLNHGDNDTPVIAIPPESSNLTRLLESSAQGSWSIRETTDNSEAEALVTNGAADAYLTPSADSGWSLVSSEAMNPQLLESLQALLTTRSLTTFAIETGATPEQLNKIVSGTTVNPVILEQVAVDTSTLLFALGIGLTVVFIVLLWGATMATDVVQEKTTRIVEILLATLRPWQLLAGKIIAITAIGILQAAVILAATWAGLKLFTNGTFLTGIPVELVIVGVVSVLIGVPLLASFMAAMAARVDHPDDVSTATQPIYLLLMAPFAAVVFLAFENPNGIMLEILSYIPVTNIFAMPVLVTVDTVTLWQLLASLAIALLTLVTAITLAGRIYSHSILRSGTTVSLREALSST